MTGFGAVPPTSGSWSGRVAPTYLECSCDNLEVLSARRFFCHSEKGRRNELLDLWGRCGGALGPSTKRIEGRESPTFRPLNQVDQKQCRFGKYFVKTVILDVTQISPKLK